MNNEISREKAKFEEKITDLVNLAELYLSFAISYRNIFDEYYDSKSIREQQEFLRHPIVSNIILHSNSYLFLSITCFHTLLKANDKSELSFAKYSHKFSCEQKEIDEIRNLFKNSLLDQVRDKIIAHKDIKNIGDAGLLAALLTHKRFFESADSVNNKINKLIQDNFKNAHANNPLLDLCEPGLKDTLNTYREILDVSFGI